MQGERYFIKSSELEYTLGEGELSNEVVVESFSEDAPAVSYLDLHFDGEIRFPIEIFSSDLTPLQALVKYSRDEKGLSNSEISSITGRSVRTIWLTYRAAKKKKLPRVMKSELLLPASFFRDDGLSIFEALVSSLRRLDYTYAQIARLLSKDQRTVWTVYSRAVKKKSGEKDDS
jgi:DNA-directed RNA polymerase specialized sigma24 family protein